jgi:hypothetical protein
VVDVEAAGLADVVEFPLVTQVEIGERSNQVLRPEMGKDVPGELVDADSRREERQRRDRNGRIG